jgi:hypothetical protein
MLINTSTFKFTYVVGFHNTEDKRETIQALSLAKECYSMKLELLTNATVVDDAIRRIGSRATTT